ncbi:MAG: hypothetical protein ACETWE_14140 [Candidatus Bathyarchaeia archaeon]
MTRSDTVYFQRQPSSYTSRKVIAQVQLAGSNLLLLTCGMKEICGTLEAKVSSVGDIAERELV